MTTQVTAAKEANSHGIAKLFWGYRDENNQLNIQIRALKWKTSSPAAINKSITAEIFRLNVSLFDRKNYFHTICDKKIYPPKQNNRYFEA